MRKKSVRTVNASILAFILILSFLMASTVMADDEWKTTSLDTDGDGDEDLDIRERLGEVHLDLNRNGAIDEGEPHCTGVWEVTSANSPDGEGCRIDIRYVFDPEAGQLGRKDTYKVKNKNGDQDTSDGGECELTMSQGGASPRFIDPADDLIDIFTGEPADEYFGYLDVTASEADKVEDKLRFSMTVNGGIPPLDESTFWMVLINKNNDLDDNSPYYPTDGADTMYSVSFQESTKAWKIEKAVYESWGWDNVHTSATWSMISSFPDGKVTITILMPILELTDFQGILTWRAMTDSASYVGDLAPDSGSASLVLDLGPPNPRIVGELDQYTVSGDQVFVEAVEMTASVTRQDVVSCVFDFAFSGDNFWTTIGQDDYPDDGWGVTWNVSDLPEGKYTVRVTMTNALEIAGTAETTAFFDPTPPMPEFVAMEYGKVINGLTTIEVSTVDQNVSYVAFYCFMDATSKTKEIPPMTQKGTDDCGPYAAASCLSYWRNYATEDDKKPFEGLNKDDTEQQREALAQDLYNRVGKSKASADKLVKAINDYISSKNVQGLKASKIDKNDVNWTTAKQQFDQGQDVLLLLCYDSRCHWVTLSGYEGSIIDLMDPASPTGELGAELKDGKLCHPENEEEVCATIEDIVVVCPTDPANRPSDPYLGTDFDGSDGWHVEWNTTEMSDGPYTVIAKMVDGDGNEQFNMTMVHVNSHPTDINTDGRIDMKDIGIAARAFNTMPGDSFWNPLADFTGPYNVADGRVDMRDIGAVARDFGKSV